MQTIRIIAIGIAGFILGLGLFLIDNNGYFQYWQNLPSPPQEISEIIPAGAPSFFIKTLDGSTYYYSSWHNEGWLQKTVPTDFVNPFEVTRPCDFSSPEFSLLTNSPPKIKDCVQETTLYADGSTQYTLAIDGKGNIWEWKHTTTAYDSLNQIIFFPFIGLLFGIVIAILTNPAKISERKPQE